jgi:hypothetical protein
MVVNSVVNQTTINLQRASAIATILESSGAAARVIPTGACGADVLPVLDSLLQAVEADVGTADVSTAQAAPPPKTMS